MVGHKRDKGAEQTACDDIGRVMPVVCPFCAVSARSRFIKARTASSPIVLLTAIKVAPISGANAIQALMAWPRRSKRCILPAR